MGKNNNVVDGEDTNSQTKLWSWPWKWQKSSFTLGLRGTVISKMWWKVMVVLFYTISVCGLNEIVEMDFTPALVPIMGTVIGFLLVFRTNTAYDRYYEGRKVWSGMNQAARRLICCIWVSVDAHDPKMVAEKQAMVNCVLAFPVAVKHYLREEYYYDYDDLKALIGNLGAFKSKIYASSIQPQKNGQRANTKRFSYICKGVPVQTNIPMEIVHCIAVYMKSLILRKLCDNSVIVTMNLAVTYLIEQLGAFERILRTPLPLAYSVHLHHALWIHILSLPFQLVATLGWWTIPAVGFTSFTLLGILEIGWEIENPFGYDDNDLPLDDFCNALRKEVYDIIGNNCRSLEDLYNPDAPPPSPAQNHDHGQKACPKYAELSVQSIDEVHIIGTGNDKLPHKGLTFINTKF